MQVRGWKVAVGLGGHGELFRRVAELGFETFPIACGPYGLGHKSIGDGARFFTQLPLLASQIRGHVRRFRPDLVYINGPRLLPAAALAHIDVPILFHAHHYLASPTLRRVAGEALRRMEASVVACCRFVAGPLGPFVDSARVTVIYNGVHGPRAMVRRRVSAAPVVGCIGRISPEKGQMEFVGAARAIHRDLPHARFIVHGAPLFSGEATRYFHQVVEAARGLPIDFPGWTRDVDTALANLDLLLAPSAPHEATTRVILEAFAGGVPVIAFASGGIPEVVEHGRTGFLVQSVDEMARTAVDLLSADPGRLDAVAQRARAVWETQFTPQRFQSRLLEAMESAVRPVTSSKLCPDEDRAGSAPDGGRLVRGA
jgi:glycosyltransferase involved in cell wall biosynthesis